MKSLLKLKSIFHNVYNDGCLWEIQSYVSVADPLSSFWDSVCNIDNID